jgi:hypothetical protein
VFSDSGIRLLRRGLSAWHAGQRKEG